MKNLKTIKTLLLLVIITVLVSCNEKAKEDTIDGVYKSVGYGRIVKIADNKYIIADVTDISCIPLMEGEISEFGEALQYQNDTLSLKDGINTYYFTKIDDAPAICKKESQAYKDAQAKINDPEYNFEVLWKTFEDHYAYWDLRNVDPKKMYAEYRPKVTAETTAPELFLIMLEMLDSFDDGHIGISASDDVEDAAEKIHLENKKNEENETKTEKPKHVLRNHIVAKAVADKYIANGISIKNGNLRWGMLDNNIGYLQINQMMGFANYGVNDSLSYYDYWRAYFEKGEDRLDSTGDELEGLNGDLDNIMADFKDTDALIIDVRFNGGGKDEVGMAVLQRLNNQDKMVFTKKGKLGEGFTPEIKVIQSSSKNAYMKPVYLLTSTESASATEIMTLSSLSLPNITRIGGRTEGVFSDVLDKVLPNGWEFGLSSEVYLDTQGENYEGLGITPDVEVGYPRNTEKFHYKIMDDLKMPTGDLAIEKAKSLIMDN